MLFCRCASIAALRIRHGVLSLSVSTFALTALPIIAILASTSLLCGQRTWTVSNLPIITPISFELTKPTVWQWDQLRIMKVGGNESATKYFQSHGGSAALASKDPKVKYTSNAANKYKEELTRRAAADAKQWVHPPSFVVTC